jgi:hypothetical protein
MSVSEAYLALSPKEQAQILRTVATNPNIKRDSTLLEKDIWICWALEFGGRNLTIPSDYQTIHTDISEYVSNLLFPIAQTNV